MEKTIDIEKLQKRIKSLAKSLKNARATFVGTLPIANDEQLESVKSKLSAYDSGAYSKLNVEYRFSDEQATEIELHLVDVENSLNTKGGTKMVVDSLKSAKRIRSFSVVKQARRAIMLE